MDRQKFTLPTLAYSVDALEPIISRETIELHWGKHHQAYIDNLNKVIAGTELEEEGLENLIHNSAGAIFNNAAQTWNHTFYFESFSPTPKNAPSAPLLDAIAQEFGSLEEFMETFVQKGADIFGSGWVWLSLDKDRKLVITQESNAGNPLKHGLTPLLTFDVWEHAYYVDYRNRRAEHLAALWRIVDWSVIDKRFE